MIGKGSKIFFKSFAENILLDRETECVSVHLHGVFCICQEELSG